MKKSFQILFYIIFIVIMFLGAIMLFDSWKNLHTMKQTISELQDKLDEKNNKILELNENIQALENTPYAIEKVAREKFKLCKEGEIILNFDVKKKKRQIKNN